MSDAVELLASYWTLATGAEPHTAQEASRVDFRERVEAAARAGFKGIGIWHADLARTLEKRSLAEMKSILDDNGIKYVELEFLGDWFMEGERKRQSDIRKHQLLTAAQALGAIHIKVGDFMREPCPMPRMIDSFGALCEEARGYNTRIGFEMMPFSLIDSIAASRELVTGAAAVNGGIVFDLWHIVKLGIPYEDVANFPTRYLTGVEINDGLLQSMPDLVVETTQHRKLCGEGEFDVKGFVRQMRAAGYKGPWGIEVLSKDLRYLPTQEAAQRAFDTTAAQFV